MVVATVGNTGRRINGSGYRFVSACEELVIAADVRELLAAP